MGIDLPLLPDAVVALLPRQAACVALVAREQAMRMGRREGRVYVAYRRLAAVLGLGTRRQCERAVSEYLAAVKAVLSAA
jgi:hypothetical protein